MRDLAPADRDEDDDSDDCRQLVVWHGQSRWSGEWMRGAGALGRCSRQAQINVHNFAKLSTGAAAMAAASASAPIKAIAPFG